MTSISYIEHYGNSGDFVAQWGILNFSKMRNRYMGRIFERPGNGHLLNQHYLKAIFALDHQGRVLEKNEFMEMQISLAGNDPSGGSKGSQPFGDKSANGGSSTRAKTHV